MITLATLGKVRYFPELIPDTSVVNLAGGATSAPILELRRFPDLFVRLNQVAVAQDPDVEMRVQADRALYAVDLGAIADYQLEPFDLEATDYLSVRFKAAAAKTNWRTVYTVWVYRPTLAHKLARGMLLTEDEQAIVNSLGLADTVQKGLLPLPLSYQTEREYVPYHEYTMTRSIQSIQADSRVLVDSITTQPGEVVILTGFACDAGTATEGITLTIDRDEDYELVKMPTYPLGMTLFVPCFIPARNSLSIFVQAAAAVTSWKIKYRIRKCRITNIMNARWGLLKPEELPGDVYAKVRGGVL